MEREALFEARKPPVSRLAWIAVAAAAVCVGFVLGQAGDDEVRVSPALAAHTASAHAVPVVVELFTSEGCSSCPPADRLLAELAASQPVPGVEIVPLSEHVDYWNRLGWTDPFSSDQFSERQRTYAYAAGSRRIYTPQMMVNGRFGFVGSERKEALAQIAKASMAPRAKIELNVCGDMARCWQVALTDLPEVTAGDTVRMVYAVTESGIEVDIESGENAGRQLPHTAVVRVMDDLGVVGKGGTFSGRLRPVIDSEWQRENLRLVVIAQEDRSRRILGVAQLPMR